MTVGSPGVLVIQAVNKLKSVTYFSTSFQSYMFLCLDGNHIIPPVATTPLGVVNYSLTRAVVFDSCTNSVLLLEHLTLFLFSFRGIFPLLAFVFIFVVFLRDAY